jgi:hypothetical protein
VSKQANKRLRRHLALPVNRDPLPAYAWPGGYPLYYLFGDGGVICPACVNREVGEIDAAVRDARGNRPHRSGCGGWAVDAVEANYEGSDLHCDHCGKPIECAYAPAEDE